MSAKSFDTPQKLIIKSIVYSPSLKSSDLKNNVKGFLFPNAIFNGVDDPFSNLTADIIAGKSVTNAITNKPRYKYSYDNNGHFLAYQGALTLASFKNELNVHRGGAAGLFYKGKSHAYLEKGVAGAVVIDDMLVYVTEEGITGAGGFAIYYVDTLNDSNNPESSGAYIRIENNNGFDVPTFVIGDSYSGVELTSQAMLPDSSGAERTVIIDNPYRFEFSHSAIDPTDFTVSVMATAAVKHGDQNSYGEELYYAVLDVVINLEIYKQTVDGITTRHIRMAGDTGGADENNNLSSRADITAVQHSENSDYNAIVASLKSTNTAVAFNLFSSETVKTKQTCASNLPCSGRVRTVIASETRYWIETTYDAEGAVLVPGHYSDWVWGNGTGTAVPGDYPEDLGLLVKGVIAGTQVIINGTVSMKYELVGSRKIAYAFIDNQRQFLTVKAAEGKSQVTFNATVSLKRPRIQGIDVDTHAPGWWDNLVINKGAGSFSGDESNWITAANNYVTSIADDTWDIAPTTEQMVLAVYYDDGDFFEGVDGINQVIGGGVSLAYSAGGWAYASYTSFGGELIAELSAASISYRLVNADKSMPIDVPNGATVANAYFNIDEKISASFSNSRSSLFGGSIRPATDETISPANVLTQVPSIGLGQLAKFFGVVETKTTITVTGMDSNRESIPSKSFLAFMNKGSTGVPVTYNGLPIDIVADFGLLDLKELWVMPQFTYGELGGAGNPVVLSVHQFNETWINLQDAYDHYSDTLYDGLFPTSFCIQNAPVPAVYYLAGQGVNGDEGGAVVGWRQWDRDLGEWRIVWKDGIGSVAPLIVPLNNDEAKVLNTDMGGSWRGSALVYDAVNVTWLPGADAGQFATHSQTEVNSIQHEKNGGIVKTTTFVDSEFTFKNVYAGNSIAYRVPIIDTNKFLYTVSVFNQGDTPAAAQTTKTYVGDKDGNILEDIPIFPSLDGDINVYDLRLENKELVLGVIE